MANRKLTDTLQFPVLTISKRGEIEVVDDLDRLQTANAVAIRNGFFIDQRIIEPTGQSYRVNNANIKSPKGKWGGFRFMKPRLYSVELVLAEDSLLTVQQAQDLVLAGVKRNKALWAAAGDVQELEMRIRQTTDCGRLFAILHD